MSREGTPARGRQTKHFLAALCLIWGTATSRTPRPLANTWKIPTTPQRASNKENDQKRRSAEFANQSPVKCFDSPGDKERRKDYYPLRTRTACKREPGPASPSDRTSLRSCPTTSDPARNPSKPYVTQKPVSNRQHQSLLPMLERLQEPRAVLIPVFQKHTVPPGWGSAGRREPAPPRNPHSGDPQPFPSSCRLPSSVPGFRPAMALALGPTARPGGQSSAPAPPRSGRKRRGRPGHGAPAPGPLPPSAGLGGDAPVVWGTWIFPFLWRFRVSPVSSCWASATRSHGVNKPANL